MNDFKTQLSGLLATLQTLPDVEQQTALALLHSSLDDQLKDTKQSYEKDLTQINSSHNGDACHSASDPTSDPHTQVIQNENGCHRQDFLEIVESSKLSHHEQRVEESTSEIILQLPDINHSVGQDSDFSDKIKNSASLQHNFSEIETSTSAFTVTTEPLEKSQDILKSGTDQFPHSQQCLPYSEVFHEDNEAVIDPGGLNDTQQLAVSLISTREAEELALVASEELEKSYQESFDAYHLKNSIDPKKNTYIMVPLLDKVKFVKVDVDLEDVEGASSLCLGESCDKVLSVSKDSSLPCSLENIFGDANREGNEVCEGNTDSDKNPIDLTTFAAPKNASNISKEDFYGEPIDIPCTTSDEAKEFYNLSSQDVSRPPETCVRRKRKRRSESKSVQGRLSSKKLKSKSSDNTTHQREIDELCQENIGQTLVFESSIQNTDPCGVSGDNLEMDGKECEMVSKLADQTDYKESQVDSGNLDASPPNLRPVSCRNCKKELADVSLLSVHQRQCEGHLTCSYCQAKFSHKVTYIKHVQGHKRNECTKCPQNFCNHKKLKAHMKAVHKVDLVSKTYSCTYCTRTFLKRSSLFYHFKIHATGTEIVCKRCGKFCKDQESYDAHMDEHTKASNFHCSICTASFTRQQQYDDHLKYHKKNKCEICGQPFTNKKALVRHCRLDHKTFPLNVPPEPQYKCDKCDRIFNRPSLLQQHQQLHTGIKPLECLVCEKQFFNKRSLRKHINTVNHQNFLYMQNDHAYIMQDGFNCEACNIKLPSKNMLLTHSRVYHKVGVTWSCPYCEYKTKRHYALKTHMELHAGNRNFMCELCGSSFHALATLKDHHNFVHSDERKYKCKECDKTFKNRSTLSRHNHTHSDARPYECKCGFRYKRYSHLKRHMSSAHNIVLKSRNLRKFKRIEELGTNQDKPISQEEQAQVTEVSETDEFEFVSVPNSSMSSTVPKILNDMQQAEPSVSKGSTNVILATQDSIMLMGENSSSEQGHLITVGDSQIIQIIPSTFQIPQDSSFQTVSLVPTSDLHTFSLSSAVPFNTVTSSSGTGVEAFNLTPNSESPVIVTQTSDHLDVSHADAISSLRTLGEETLGSINSDDRDKQEGKQMIIHALGNPDEISMSSNLHTFDYSESNHTLLPSLLPHHPITHSHPSNSQMNQELLQQNLMCSDFVLPVDGDR